MSPQQSAAALRTHANLQVDLMLAEPWVSDPVAIDFGPDGRLWVAEMADYPSGQQGKFEAGGRIRVLESVEEVVARVVDFRRSIYRDLFRCPARSEFPDEISGSSRFPRPSET